MTPETRPKVFDPFFTTKPTGHGLGLATVQGIVRSLDGTIHLTSEPGTGTTFDIVLPCTETTLGSVGRPTASLEHRATPLSGGTILVVDDEDPLRQAVTKLLRKNGFHTVEAADGSAAIEILRAGQARIDAILLDVTIPGASSHEVAAEATKIRPDAKVILTSAYSQEMLSTAIDGPQIRGFIRKPYQLTNLTKMLLEILSA
jgi:CheY-like chemotaxis protein